MSAVTWVAVGLGAIVAVGIVLIAYCCWTRGGYDETDPSTLLDGLLRRDQLEDTMLENGEQGWQCVVCAYSNSEKHKNCLMCGTSAGFLMTSALARHKSSGALLKNDDASGVQEEDLRARQRALFKRRMNSMSLRKDLSQRQRGAIRRRLWERKQDAEGKFHWIRQNSTDHFNDTALSGNAMILQSSGRGGASGNTRGVQVTGPLESMTDYHNLRSQGFVWQYDDLGRLVWKQAEDGKATLFHY